MNILIHVAPLTPEPNHTFPEDLASTVTAAGIEVIPGEWHQDSDVSRAGDALSAAALLAIISPVALPGILSILQAWVQRHDNRSIEIELTGKHGTKRLKISGEISNDTLADYIKLAKTL